MDGACTCCGSIFKSALNFFKQAEGKGWSGSSMINVDTVLLKAVISLVVSSSESLSVITMLLSSFSVYCINHFHHFCLSALI